MKTEAKARILINDLLSRSGWRFFDDEHGPANVALETQLKMYFEDDELERFGLRMADVLVCEGGEPGRAAVWDGRMPDLKYQKALHRVRFRIPYEPQLLVYWLQTLAKSREWEQRFHGATIKHFTREMFLELAVPIPPLDEQREIVGELEAERKLVEANRELIARFEQKLQAKLAEIWGEEDEAPSSPQPIQQVEESTLR